MQSYSLYKPFTSLLFRGLPQKIPVYLLHDRLEVRDQLEYLLIFLPRDFRHVRLFQKGGWVFKPVYKPFIGPSYGDLREARPYGAACFVYRVAYGATPAFEYGRGGAALFGMLKAKRVGFPGLSGYFSVK